MMEPRSPEAWWPCFQQAMRNGDIEGVLQLYAPTAVFTNRMGQVRSGLASLREEFRPLAAAKADFAVTVKKIVRSDDLALVYSDWRLTRPQPNVGYALEVLRRQQDGRWLLVIGDPFTIGQWSDGAHPATPPAPEM